MKRLVLHATDTAQWQALVHEAEAAAECSLSVETESYLVFTLMRFGPGAPGQDLPGVGLPSGALAARPAAPPGPA